MPTILETLVVKLAGDGADYDETLKKASGSLDDFEKKAKNIGGSLTTNVTLPLLALGGAAIKFSTDLNAGLGNIQSLGIAEERVLDLKTGFQDLAIETGKSVDDIVGGGYEVISTWGDTAETLNYVEINARAAAAGLSTTQEAIALTSAVTKGYGDTSVEATQKAADLAFQTVNLGQTTFPELAASMGKVVPIAAALGVTQEELFGQMATLTGVTGNAAEVTTQLRALYTSILKPTTDMGQAIQQVAVQLDAQGKLAGGPQVDAWHRAIDAHSASVEKMHELEAALGAVDTSTKEGVASAKELEGAIKNQKKANEDTYESMIKQAAGLGQSIVASVGLTDATNLLTATADGNTDTMGKMYGSVEAVTAVLAMTGGQADSLTEKMAAMQDVTGAVDKAFTAQTEGLNANGFTMAQTAVKAQVLMEKLGDGLAPALSKVLDIAGPWVEKLIEMADWFANADSGTQTWIISLVAIVAAIGPVVTFIGTMAGAISGIMGLIGGTAGLSAMMTGLGAVIAAIGWPITLIIAAVAALALAWGTDFLGIRTKTEEFWNWITGQWPGWTGSLQSGWEGFSNWWQSDTATKTESVKTLWGNTQDWIGEKTQMGVLGVQTIWSGLTTWLDSHTGGALTSLQNQWQGNSDTIQSITQSQWDSVRQVVDFGVTAVQGLVTAGTQFMRGDWEGGMQTLRDTSESMWGNVQQVFQNQLDTLRGIFDIFGWSEIGENIITGIANGMTASLSWIEDAARSAAQSALDTAKSWLGIGSPSKRAGKEIGEPFSQGVGVGAIDAMPHVADRIQSAMQGLMGNLSAPQPAMAGQGGRGPITLNIYLQGKATYEDGRAVGAGIDDELRARGLK